MSIRVSVESYCQTCGEFEPDVERLVLMSDERREFETNIHCLHRDRCSAMYENIKIAAQKEEQTDD